MVFRQVFAGDPIRSLWDRVPDDELNAVLPFLSKRPVPVGLIAAALNLCVMVDALDVNISGSIQKTHDDPAQFRVTVNVADAPVRQRFTVAHEIAHYLLHRNLIDKDGIVDTILYRSSLSNIQEVEANRLASSILLPWREVHNWCMETSKRQPDLESLFSIAHAFRVSELTVGFRFGF